MSEKEEVDHFSSLPYEILAHIFQICKEQEVNKCYISVNQVSDLRLVCKKFHQGAWDPIYLTELRLSGERPWLFDRYVHGMSQRPNLTTLRLSTDNEMLLNILKQAATHCPNLKHLDIWGAYNGEPDDLYQMLNPMAALENMPHLTSLSVEDIFCENEETFQSIGKSNVVNFSYTHSQTTAKKRKGIGKALEGLRNKLTSLRLYCEVLDNKLLHIICQCKHLETLFLPWLEDVNVDLSVLSKLKNLRSLGLDGCEDNFTGSKVSRCLKGMVRLEKLEITHNQNFCESDLKAVVETCTNLKILKIFQCRQLQEKGQVLKFTAPSKKLQEVYHGWDP